MPNLVKISRRMKRFSTQLALDSDRSVCMTAMCYSGPISAVPINEPLLGEKSRVWYLKMKDYFEYIKKQTDSQTWLN